MSSDRNPIGVILFNLGGPDDLRAVEPFLVKLFSDREIIELPLGRFVQPAFARLIAKVRGPGVRRNYQLIGGGSPQLPITRAQAAALEDRLNHPFMGAATGRAPRPGFQRFRVQIAMRYSQPSSADALERLEEERITRIVTLPLFPHWSKATTGSSQGELRRTLEEPRWRDRSFHVTHIDQYPDDPVYLDAFADTVRRAYDRLSAEGRRRGAVLFSAHGLPERFVTAGDPYVAQIEATMRGLLERLELPIRHALGYQSRTGPVKWIGPGTEEMIGRLAAEGVEHLLIVPLSFVSDHIETLYEVDILFREAAEKAGIREYVRPDALNTHPLFIESLARLVERTVVPAHPREAADLLAATS
jgi:ferrochelatase